MRGFWRGNNKRPTPQGEDQATADRHQAAILSKNFPHLQQEGSHFWERWHQGSE